MRQASFPVVNHSYEIKENADEFLCCSWCVYSPGARLKRNITIQPRVKGAKGKGPKIKFEIRAIWPPAHFPLCKVENLIRERTNLISLPFQMN